MSEENVIMNLSANADFSNLVSSVNRVTASLLKMQEQIGASNRILTGQIAQINKAFSDTLRQTGQFGTHFVTLTDDVEKFGSNLDRGQLKLRDYYSAWQNHARTSGGLIRQLAQQQVQLQNAILQPLGKNAQGLMQFNVQVPKGLDLVKNKTALTTQELKIMNKVMQEGANQLINWGKNTQWAGRQLTVGLTVPIAAFGAAASKAFREADQELVRLTKVYGGVAATSKKELAQIRKEVEATANTLAKQYGASYKETIGLAADLAATGKQGNDLLKATAETTRLMVLGEVDRQEAMKTTLTIQNTFKENTKQLADSINFLNAVENQTSLTIQDLTEAIPKAGPVVKALGGNVKDLALYLTAMKEGGIGAAEGANAIKSAFASLINPTKVATDMFRSFGIDLKGMVSKNTGNTTQLLLDLQAALDKLDPLSKSKAIEQLFGKFQFSRMTALIDNLGKQGSQSLQVLDLLKQSTGDIAAIADRELKQVTESASGKYKRAVEGLKADLAGIGDEFLKIQTFFINVTDKIVKFVNTLPGPIKSILTFLTGLTAVAGPLIMLTGVMANFIGWVIKGAFHFKSLFKSGEGWRLLTPEILAAQKAGALIESTFYSDAKAALALAEALSVLESGYGNLQTRINNGVISVKPTISTIAGSIVVPGASAMAREVDPNNPLVGQKGTRASAHINPVRGRTQAQIDASTIFGFVPGPIPVNNAIKDTPQIYTNGDLPSVPGLTTSSSKHGPVSTGIVAGEATKWHTLMGTLSMMSKTEVAAMKKEIATTGTVSTEFMSAYSSLLPEITKISEKAVIDSAAIVSQVKAGELSLAQAKEKLIQLNYEIETAMGTATTNIATSIGRTANITTVPTLDQPVVDPKGKSNMRQLFGKGNASWLDRLAGLFNVKTWGASYSTHTTRPKRLNSGGAVYDPSRDGNVVPGDTSINYDNTPAKLREGGFILNQTASKNNPGLVNIAKNGYNSGGRVVDALLTPGETYFPPELAQQIMPTLEQANNGSRVQLRALGGLITPIKTNYGAVYSAGSVRGKPRNIFDIFGVPTHGMEFNAKGERLGKVGAGGIRSKLISLVAKPATGLYGKITSDIKLPINPKTGKPHTLESLNELMAGKGLSGSDLDAYILTLRAAEINGAIHGSTSQFLYSLPEDIISRKEAIRLAKLVDNDYLQTISGMSMSLTDSNNPYHDISKHHILNSNNSILGELWRQYSRQLSGLNPLYESDLASGRGHSNSAGAKSIVLFDPRDPKRKFVIGKLKGSSKDNSMFFHSANRDWESHYGLDQYMPAQAANLGGIIGGKVHSGKKNYGFMPSWIIRNEKVRSLSNTDPLHGPLQIGRYQPPLTVRTRRVGAGIQYKSNYTPFTWERGPRAGETSWSPRRTSKVPAFLTGSLEDRGRYVTEEYMRGNYEVLSIPGATEAMKAWGEKTSGIFHRGITLKGWSKVGGQMPPLPKWLIDEILLAQKTGDYSQLIGKDFIMRRSSWSSNKETASGFGDFQLVANVKNRKVTPASQMFPSLDFYSPGSKVLVNESESIFGGKFRITNAGPNGLELETVSSPFGGKRAMGGSVNSGMPYLVGENGPELFTPNASGSIIPNYALGGKVTSGKSGYGLNPKTAAASFIGKNALSLLAWIVGPKLLEKMGVDSKLVNNLMTAGFIGQLAMGGRKVYKNAKLAGAGAGEAETAANLVKTEGLLARFGPTFGKIGFMASRASIPITILLTGLTVYEKLQANHKRNQEVFATSFGLSAKTAKEAGVQVKSLNDILKAARDNAAATNTKAGILFGADKTNISGINLTVKQLKDLESSVKKTMPTYVEAFRRMTGKDIETGAVRIKSQWVALGMSVEEANAKIYSLIKLTHGSAAALSAMQNESFQGITDQATAAKQSISLLATAIKNVNNVGTKGVADSLNTFLQTQMVQYQKLINNPENSKTSTPVTDAYRTLMSQYTASGMGKLKLPEGTVSELAKTDPLLASILGKSETIASAMNKWIVASSGTVANLEKLANIDPKVADKIAAGVIALQDASNKALSTDALIGPKESQIKTLIKNIGNASKASAGMTVVDQVATKKRIKFLEDEIKKINEAAAARKKAMEQQQQDADTLTQIQKKQLEYQQALASGDMAAAAQAQLDIQQLTQNRQLEIAKNAIDTNAANRISPLQQEIDALNTKLNASADAQAIAAESMNNMTNKLNDLVSKDTALKSSLQKALDDKLIYGANSTQFQNDIKVLLNDYAALAGLKKNKEGVYVDSNGKTITAEGLYAALEKATLKQVQVNGTTVIVNGAIKAAKDAGITGSTSALPAASQDAITANQDTAANYDPTKPGSKKPKADVPPPPTVTTNGKAAANAMHNPLVPAVEPGKFYVVGDSINDPNISKYSKQSGAYTYLPDGNVIRTKDRQIVGQWFAVGYGPQGPYTGKVVAYGGGSPGGVKGPGTGTSDSIPAFLSNGEYVIKASTVSKYGIPFFDALNAQHFDKGGQPSLWSKIVHSAIKMIDPLKFGNHSLAYEFGGGKEIANVLSGTKNKSDYLTAGLSMIPFAGRGSIALKAAPELINPIKASTQIMRNLNGSMLESALAQGRKVPRITEEWWKNTDNATPYLEQFKDMFSGTTNMNPLLMSGDYGNAFRKYWGRAYEHLISTKDPAIKGINSVDDFFREIATKTPGWASSWSEDAAKPLIQAANKAYMLAHGLHPEQPLALFKAARQAGRAGYTSISSKFARSYLKDPHLGIYRDAMDAEAGLYKIIAKAGNLKDPIGLGGMYDEFANVIPPSLDNAIKIGTGTTRAASRFFGRTPNISDFYSALNLGKMSNGSTYGALIPEHISQIESLLSKMDIKELTSKMKLPKFENGINMVPADMLALIHKNEAILPANMNPFNPSANNATMGNTIYLTNHITAAPGMDTELLAMRVVDMTKKALSADMSVNTAKVGASKEFGSKVMRS